MATELTTKRTHIPTTPPAAWTTTTHRAPLCSTGIPSWWTQRVSTTVWRAGSTLLKPWHLPPVSMRPTTPPNLTPTPTSMDQVTGTAQCETSTSRRPAAHAGQECCPDRKSLPSASPGSPPHHRDPDAQEVDVVNGVVFVDAQPPRTTGRWSRANLCT